MFRFLLVALLVAIASGFMAPIMSSKLHVPKVAMNGGKGFGGGEATRDPEPTVYDPNDPKGKQQAIHKAESFAEYLAKRSVSGGVNPTSTPAAAAPAAAAPAPAPAPEPAYEAPVAASYTPPAPVGEDAAKAAWLAKLDQPTWGASSNAAPLYTPAGSASSAAPARAGRVVPASKSRVPKPAAGTWDEYATENHIMRVF